MPRLHALRNIQIFRHPQEATRDPRPTALAIGNFDGVHRGHQAVLATMREAAQRLGLAPAILTFEPHPRRLFAPDSPPFRILSLREKLIQLEAARVARAYLPPFTRAFAAMEAEDFLETILRGWINARAIIIGEDFAFGAGRRGNVTMLRAWGAAHGIEILTVPAVAWQGETCSSSAIREALAVGDMPHVEALLGRPYSLAGRVVHGDGRGRKIGFATANVHLPHGLRLPQLGVYAVRLTVQDAFGTESGIGVANLGLRPTVGQQPHPSLEVHRFDWAGDCYGARMRVELIHHLRGEMKFGALSELTHQIALDAEAARKLLGR